MKLKTILNCLALLLFLESGAQNEFDKYGPMGGEVCSNLEEYFKAPKKIYKLDLSYKQIEPKLYDKISTITDLQTIKLSGNNTNVYPRDFDKLVNLVYFASYNNKLSSFPPNLKAYALLQHLELQHTAIDSIPAHIAYLQKLQTLRFGNTEDSVKLPGTLKYLRNLKEISFENCILDSVPTALFAIPSLKFLFLSSTNTKRLPADFEKLPNLEVLVIENNPLAVLPFTIYKASRLRILALRGNKLKRLPESISQLENLSILDLRGNPLEAGEIEKLKALLPGCEVKF